MAINVEDSNEKEDEDEKDDDEEQSKPKPMKLVAKPVIKKKKNPPRMNPEITPSFILDKNSGYTYF